MLLVLDSLDLAVVLTGWSERSKPGLGDNGILNSIWFRGLVVPNEPRRCSTSIIVHQGSQTPLLRFKVSMAYDYLFPGTHSLCCIIFSAFSAFFGSYTLWSVEPLLWRIGLAKSFQSIQNTVRRSCVVWMARRWLATTKLVISTLCKILAWTGDNIDVLTHVTNLLQRLLSSALSSMAFLLSSTNYPSTINFPSIFILARFPFQIVAISHDFHERA